MATEEAPSPDEFTIVDSSPETNDDDELIELEPGEEMVAQIRHIEPDTGYNGLLHLTRDSGEMGPYFMPAKISREVNAYDPVPGEWIFVKKGSEEHTFTDDDGEERSYYDHEVGFMEAN